jgi:hypothetical protein
MLHVQAFRAVFVHAAIFLKGETGSSLFEETKAAPGLLSLTTEKKGKQELRD